MKAVVHTRYGTPDVLRVEDVERPVPKADEVVVKVRATTVNRTDCAVRSGKPVAGRIVMRMLGIGGVFRPRRLVLGSEFAGDVQAIGAAVTRFAVGDRVFGVNASKYGAHAELLAVAETSPIAHMPTGMSFEEAAAICDGAILALNCLEKADLRPGRSLLVHGASGSMGTAGVQLGRFYGAHVTAVCSTKNLELMRTLGADEAIDYLEEDFTANGKTYDVIFDAVGKHSFKRAKGSLNPGGLFFPTDGMDLLRGVLLSRFGNKRIKLALPPRYAQEDVLFLKELVETGKYRAVIDRTYPLADVVEATRYVETEQKTGNVVLTVSS